MPVSWRRAEPSPGWRPRASAGWRTSRAPPRSRSAPPGRRSVRSARTSRPGATCCVRPPGCRLCRSGVVVTAQQAGPARSMSLMPHEPAEPGERRSRPTTGLPTTRPRSAGEPGPVRTRSCTAPGRAARRGHDGPSSTAAVRGAGRGHGAARRRRRARLWLPLLAARLPDPAPPRRHRHPPHRPAAVRRRTQRGVRAACRGGGRTTSGSSTPPARTCRASPSSGCDPTHAVRHRARGPAAQLPAGRARRHGRGAAGLLDAQGAQRGRLVAAADAGSRGCCYAALDVEMLDRAARRCSPSSSRRRARRSGRARSSRPGPGWALRRPGPSLGVVPPESIGFAAAGVSPSCARCGSSATRSPASSDVGAGQGAPRPRDRRGRPGGAHLADRALSRLPGVLDRAAVQRYVRDFAAALPRALGAARGRARQRVRSPRRPASGAGVGVEVPGRCGAARRVPRASSWPGRRARPSAGEPARARRRTTPGLGATRRPDCRDGRRGAARRSGRALAGGAHRRTACRGAGRASARRTLGRASGQEPTVRAGSAWLTAPAGRSACGAGSGTL